MQKQGKSSTNPFSANESSADRPSSPLKASGALPSSSTLRAGGHRLTRQRQLVLEVLQENPGHPDAETIFLLAKARDPRISLATVYRTLSLLNETGLVLKHSLGEDHGHFETAQSAPHYHFTCARCGRVIEFQAPQLMEAARELCDREGVQISEISLLFSGICSDCRKGDSPLESSGI